MENIEREDDRSQILSVHNLEKFNDVIAIEDEKTLEKIIKDMETEWNVVVENEDSSERGVSENIPSMDELKEMINTMKHKQAKLTEANAVKSKIIIPPRITRNADDTEDSDSDSSTLPDTTSEDTGRKSITPMTSDASNSEEESSEESSGNRNRIVSSSSSSGIASDDGVPNRNEIDGGCSSTDSDKTNEIIRNTMIELNNKNKIKCRPSGVKTLKDIKTISSTLESLNTGNTVREFDKKPAVIPFDIVAARTLNADSWVPSLVDKDQFNHDDDSSDGKNSYSINSTNIQDDNGKFFTILHDMPKDGPCKICPKMQFTSIKQWWKIQQNLAPRSRQYLRISLVVLGSALLLLAIFLLARLPSSRNDVVRHMMYDLPSDDAFRPVPPHHLANRHNSAPDLQDLPPLPQVDHPDVVDAADFVRVRGSHRIPRPGSNLNLEDLAQRAGVALHPKLGVPVDETYLEMERNRKSKVSNLLSYRGSAGMEEVLKKVQNTIEVEKKNMEGKEANIWNNGKTPLRILLVSTWRSGSTFLGQVLQQHPGVFQHYEPFSYLGIKQIRSGSEAFQSQQVLHRLLDCRYAGQDQYLNYTKMNPIDMSGHNKRIWNPCKMANRVDICSNATFLTKSCEMFPIQLVKTVRLRLNLTQLFLGETRLNAKVVFLVRDPRATISSRRSSVKWCDTSSDCSDPEVLCSDLKGDLKVSAALERLYPKSFFMVRYEDLANNPDTILRELFDFLGMEFSDGLAQFVAEHTESEVEKPWSIARKSAARVSRWKDKLAPVEVEDIQKTCKDVIDYLGYDMV